MENGKKPRDDTYLQKAKYNVRTSLKRTRFLHAYCPKCSAKLIKGSNVRLIAVGEEGTEEILELAVYLNIYEAEHKHSIIMRPTGEFKDVKCPHCNQSIVHPTVMCQVCGSHAAEMSVAAVHTKVPFFFCMNIGCQWDGMSQEDELLLIQDSSRQW
jgi:ribosomal protein S27E